MSYAKKTLSSQMPSKINVKLIQMHHIYTWNKIQPVALKRSSLSSLEVFTPSCSQGPTRENGSMNCSCREARKWPCGKTDSSLIKIMISNIIKQSSLQTSTSSMTLNWQTTLEEHGSTYDPHTIHIWSTYSAPAFLPLAYFRARCSNGSWNSAQRSCSALAAEALRCLTSAA